ncbi:GDPmannose 4,6-dehydratase [Lachnospiraceae bacterium NE2001]|nr:GDPmannose 4,6-dehydratase [Lachnospiraceae bacterium NE2001]
MKILIFGANGFVGPYLINEFLNSGYEVVASDIQDGLLKDDFREKLYDGRAIRYQRCDILSVESVEALIREELPDGMVNLAAISSVGQSWSAPSLTMSINVIGALNVLEAVRGSMTSDYSPKLLFIGSSEEYEISDEPLSEKKPLDATNPYGVSKVAQEHFTEIYRKNYGMNISYVRAFNHTGVGQRETFVLPSFVRQVAEIEKSGQPGTILVGNLDIYRDFSDVRDIVRGYRMVFEAEQKSDGTVFDNKTTQSQVYNIGSGTAYNLAELLEYIISLSSEKILTNVDPVKYRPTDQRTIVADTTLIQEELGWKPEYDIYDTLKEMFYYYLQNV